MLSITNKNFGERLQTTFASKDTVKFKHQHYTSHKELINDKIKELQKKIQLYESKKPKTGIMATYYDTKMWSEPYTLTADMFNSLRNNLDFAYYTGISKVFTGDAVLGEYFVTLTEATAIDNMGYITFTSYSHSETEEPCPLR